MHIKLGKLTPDQHYTFALNLRLQGTQQLSIAPLGRETHVSLSSDWPHPSFVGDFLPAERQVDQHGFSARWQTSYFSTNLAEHFRQCAARVECHSYHQARFGVSLIGFYVSHVLQSLSRAAGFTGALGLLYALLYGLLSAEDYALLMGSLLIFALLGGFMAVTRRVDWYCIGRSN